MTSPGGVSTGAATAELVVGDEVELEIGPVAHGGSCVARADGRVVFVRYALPGERALVRITEAKPGSFCRGVAVAVLRADPRRVAAPCAHFGPRRPDGSGGCGGCDFQHASGELQRELKAHVVAEQLQRLAGIERDIVVESLPGGGFGWRSRVRWAVDSPGGSDGHTRVGPRRYRSHEVVPVTAEQPCLIAADGITGAVTASPPPTTPDGAVAADEAIGIAGGDVPARVLWRRRGKPIRRPADGGQLDDSPLIETAAGREFRLDAAGFWQAHRHVADTLCNAVTAALDAHLPGAVPLPGAIAWDLYGGVGVFAAVLADLVGPSGRVVSVESDRRASAWARRNLADQRQVRVIADRVERAVRHSSGGDKRRKGRGPQGRPSMDRVDVVVLDPPRSGAGAQVCRALVERKPAVIVYVACDPAALARDTATLGLDGYELESVRAFDAFPQTHHVECVARFIPAS